MAEETAERTLGVASLSPQDAGKDTRVAAVIVGEDPEVHHIVVSGNALHMCPANCAGSVIVPPHGIVAFSLPPDGPHVPNLVGKPDREIPPVIYKALRELGVEPFAKMPAGCKWGLLAKSLKRVAVRSILVADPARFHLSPGTSTTYAGASGPDCREVFLTDESAQKFMPNTEVILSGKPWRYYDTQAFTFVASGAQPVLRADPELGKEDVETLAREFFPGGTLGGIERKTLERVRYLTALAGTVGRENMADAVDLLLHSPDSFFFNNRPVNKGWLEVVLVGDTRSAKTQTVRKILEFYRTGVYVGCEVTTRAFVLGGMEIVGSPRQGSGRRQVPRYGIVSSQTGGVVLFDEAHELVHKGILKDLSVFRSEGVAAIQVRGGGIAPARTRAIWVGNCPGDTSMADHTFPIDVIWKFFLGRPEDVARVDVALTFRADIAAEDINEFRSTAAPAMPDGTLWELHGRWSRSRKSPDISFTEAATVRILAEANRLLHKYGASSGIFDTGSAAVKLARVAAAQACRMFATENGKTVTVEEAHALWAVAFYEAMCGSGPGGLWIDQAFAYSRGGSEEREALKTHAYSLGENRFRRFLRFLVSPDTRETFQTEHLADLLFDGQRHDAVAFLTAWAGMGAVLRAGRTRSEWKPSPLLREVVREWSLKPPTNGVFGGKLVRKKSAAPKDAGEGMSDDLRKLLQ